MKTKDELLYEALGDDRKIMVVEKTVVEIYCIEFNDETFNSWTQAVDDEDIPEGRKHNRLAELALNSYLSGKVDGHAGNKRTKIKRPTVSVKKREPHHQHVVINPDNFEAHGFSYDEIGFNGQDYFLQVMSSLTEEESAKYFRKREYFDETDPDKW